MTPGAPSIELSDFHLDVLATIEEITHYVPGGFHPAVIGDILGDSSQRQYRLMHKLGWGGYSTVWLAQTTDEMNALVAIKITKANGDNGAQSSQEVEMLQKAQPADDQSYSHVLKLIDHFKLHGPNGTHTVIVTEVVVPILSLSQQPPAWRKAAAYGIAQAMAQLHASQIVHGDWHLGNLGVAMPQLAHQDSGDVMRKLGEHDINVVPTMDATKQTASLPAYLISPCEIDTYYKKIAGSDLPQIKILDFGSAHDVGTHPVTLQCALGAQAPEIISARLLEKIDNPAIDPPAEVWALGVTIYGIITSSELDLGLPLHMSKLAGRIPPHWEKWSASLSGKIIPQTDADEWWASHWEKLRKGCKNDKDTAALIRLLKRVFVLDPAERPTAAQIMNDPWFQSVLSPMPLYRDPFSASRWNSTFFCWYRSTTFGAYNLLSKFDFCACALWRVIPPGLPDIVFSVLLERNAILLKSKVTKYPDTIK